MGYKAIIDDRDTIITRNVRILVAHDRGTTVTAYTGGGPIDINPREGASGIPDHAWWTIPDDALPVLLAALAKHLGAVEHPQQLRADFEHERRRVDTFINAMINRGT